MVLTHSPKPTHTTGTREERKSDSKLTMPQQKSPQNDKRPSFNDRKQAKLEQAAHQGQLSQGFEDTSVEYLREMVETNLDPGTVRVLDNYLSPDFVLGNDREEDYHEFKWLLEIKIQRVFERHPPEGGVGGIERSYYYDDHSDALSALSGDEREVIRTYKDGILKRARRSVDGMQQEEIGKTTSRVETVDTNDDDGSRGLFG